MEKGGLDVVQATGAHQRQGEFSSSAVVEVRHQGEKSPFLFGTASVGTPSSKKSKTQSMVKKIVMEH